MRNITDSFFFIITFKHCATLAAVKITKESDVSSTTFLVLLRMDTIEDY